MVKYLKARRVACLAAAVAATVGAGCSSDRGCRSGCPARPAAVALAPINPASISPVPAPPGGAAVPSSSSQLPTQPPSPATLPPTPAARHGGQTRCPVMGDLLGEMGDPIPVAVKGQTVYVCCKGCVAKVQRDPDKYLAVVAAERAGR